MSKVKATYEDFYGGRATITETGKGTFRLKCWTSQGRITANKEYETYMGARRALGRLTDGVKEVV